MSIVANPGCSAAAGVVVGVSVIPCCLARMVFLRFARNDDDSPVDVAIVFSESMKLCPASSVVFSSVFEQCFIKILI